MEDYTPEISTVERLKTAVAAMARIESVRTLSTSPHPEVEFVLGKEGDYDEFFFESIAGEFEKLGYMPLLAEQEGRILLRALPGVPDKETGRAWVNALLFFATLLSVTFVGAANEGGNPLRNPADLWLGLPFAATLLGILTVHELSHYFVGRRYDSPVSLPYFIPLPVSILGTMGAVITQKAPMRSRKALFDIGAAGPLGGLLVAFPLLIWGLLLSEVAPLPTEEAYLLEGNSVLYYLLKWLIFGQPLPAGGVDVMLHPMAFAAWAGLMVSALNLFPIGQLDGGHVAYALWGRTSWLISRVFVWLMIGWGIFLNLTGQDSGWTWVIWGALGALMGAEHPLPLNDLTPLDATRRWVGWGMVLLFFLIVIPIPLTIVSP